MDLSKFSFISKIFTIAIIAVIYVIIFFIIKIMYKDMKDSGKRNKRRKKYGLEVLEIKGNDNFKVGSVIPIGSSITVGRKDDNVLVLSDRYVSSYHAKIYLKNNNCIIKDLNSTNGTFVNNEKIEEAYLRPGDSIQIGKSTFKMIG